MTMIDVTGLTKRYGPVGDLDPHVEAALADHTVATEVRTAWEVLATVAAKVLGDRV